ncbi:MAG: TfoX/Sxy family protein [Peptococcaceae bacterium]|nr:TfoX/Sxy family protein [Peptococcaceae bacterium]
MTELNSMRNIGRMITQKLKSVDISTAEELKQVGSKEAFARLKMHYPNTCLVTLYSLEGAVSDTEYNQLSEDMKQDLKAFSDNLTRALPASGQ